MFNTDIGPYCETLHRLQGVNPFHHLFKAFTFFFVKESKETHFVRSLSAPTQPLTCLTRDPPKQACMRSKPGLQMNLSVLFGMTNSSRNPSDGLPYSNVAFA